MDKISFFQGEESIVIHEAYKERGESLFVSQYKTAFAEIDAYLDAPSMREDFVVCNNVFAFVGERGSGKTSCMLSVADMLEAHRTEIGRPKSFFKTPIVDPSFFDEKTNIIEILLGKLYVQFDNYLKQNVPPLNKTKPYKKNNVLSAFEQVRECSANIHTGSTFAIEQVNQLPELSATMDLATQVGHLIDVYLDLVGKEILVIPIDDIDLHSAQANIMAEQIRKYLMHPNVVILMALKIDQLLLLKEKEYIYQYKDLIDKNRINIDNIIDMASKYMTKLIPLNHRIFMPTIEDFENAELQLINNREEKNVLLSGSSVKYTVTSLIFRKCRFLFYHSNGTTSPIVPRNLRELRHLIAMLYSMTDYRTSWDESNKVLFEQYVYETWISNNLNAKDIALAREIRNFKDVSTFNKSIVQILKRKYADVFGTELRDEIKRILDDENVTYNISVGDVFVIIDYLKKRIQDVEEKMFIFYVVTVYSMKLYYYYDRLTASPQTISKPANENIDSTIKKREQLDEISEYEIFAAGSFINTNYFDLLTPERDGSTYVSRSQRGFDIGKIRQWIAAMPIEFQSLSSEQLHQLYLAEFFALTLSRRYDSKNRNIGMGYRKSDEVYYASRIGQSTIFATFDIGSILFNIADIEKAYKRMSNMQDNDTKNKLLDIAKKEPTSIYNRIQKVVEARGFKEDEDENPGHSLRSWGLIRNAEILEDFMMEMVHKPTARGISALHKENIEDFLGRMANYEIKTYDRNSQTEPYTIEFKYANEIKSAIHEVSDAEFNMVYGIEEFNVEQIIANFNDTIYKEYGVRQNLSRICAIFFKSNKKFQSALYAKIKEQPTYTKLQLEELLTKFNENYYSQNG